MTRRVTFASGHRYWRADWTEAQNREVFGSWGSPYNHGHNYVLDVEVTGSVDPANGMVVNIKVIDDIIRKEVVSLFDNKSINDEVSGFDAVAPCVENLLAFIAGKLSGGVLPPSCTLTHLRLEEMPLLYGTLTPSQDTDRDPMVTLTRVYEFAASHRLNVEALPLEQNLALFGKCNNVNGHGHNYVLEVTVTGQPDATTGMICSIGDLDSRVKEVIMDRYDHKNLNEDLPEYAGVNTTSEVVAQKIFDDLLGQVPAQLYSVRLHETARNIFEVRA